MSIYLGSKQGKLYKGDYHPAQFYKGDTKIAGYAVAQKQGTAIECMDTYNDALNPTIKGKSEQTVTVQGKNLFDEERILPTQGWVKQSDGSFFVQNNGIPYRKVLWENIDGYTGQIAITIQHRRSEVGDIYSGAVPLISYTDGSIQYTGGSTTIEWSTSIRLSDSTKTVSQISWSYGAKTIGTYVKDILIAKSSTTIPYIPFIPNSPSPDYPSPIRSSENFDVVSCGRNLAPHSDFSKNHDGWVCNQASEVTQGVDYVQCIVKQTISTPGLIRREMIANLVKGKTYTMTVCAKAVGVDEAVLHSYGLDVPGWSGLIVSGQFTAITKTFIAVRSQTFDTLFCFHNPQLDTGFQIKWFQIEEGATSNLYQPYHATTTHITDPLRSVGDVSDSIEVSEGKVEVVRRVAVRKLTGDTSERWSQYGSSLGQKYACMYGQILIGKRIGPILFTHDPQAPSIVIGGIALGIWANTNPTYPEHVYWGIEYSLIGTNQTSTVEENVSALRLWLSNQATAGTPVTIQYQLATPTRTDITATPLGQALLALRTQPHYTQVYTNAEIQPMLMAKIKELLQ